MITNDGRGAKGWTGERDGPSGKTTKVEVRLQGRQSTTLSDSFMGFNKTRRDIERRYNVFCAISLSKFVETSMK